MTKIIFGQEEIEVVASPERPNRGILITLGHMGVLGFDPSLSDEKLEHLSEQNADQILNVYDAQTNHDNN
jgi:hypothetical protein